MGDPGQTAAPRFWRCGGCGTHNPAAGYVTQCLGCGAGRGSAAVVEVAPAGAGAGERLVVLRPRKGRALLAASWAYAALMLLALVLLRWVGDAWWVVTVFLLAPRWVLLAPPAALAVASAVRGCPAHWLVQGAAALIVAGPLMGVSLPIRQLWETPPAGDRVRIVAYNMGARPIRQAAFRDWLARERVDVVCLQEASKSSADTLKLLGEGWHASRNGTIASRLPLVADLPRTTRVHNELGQMPGYLERVRLRSPSGREFLVASVHLPTLRPGLEAFRHGGGGQQVRLSLAWWRHEAELLLSDLAEADGLPMVVGGDFNMPSDDSTMAALRAHFRFAFEEAGWGYGYTRPKRLPWVRIDHVLFGPEWYATMCRVGPDFDSDHLPVLAEVVLPTPAR